MGITDRQDRIEEKYTFVKDPCGKIQVYYMNQNLYALWRGRYCDSFDVSGSGRR